VNPVMQHAPSGASSNMEALGSFQRPSVTTEEPLSHWQAASRAGRSNGLEVAPSDGSQPHDPKRLETDANGW
jgi:hypothetical protein